MKLYQGDFNQDKLGIEDLVKEYNLSLDQEFKAKHQAAIASLQSISVPFGEAIFSQQLLVQQAIDNINSLEEVITQKIRPFILQYVHGNLVGINLAIISRSGGSQGIGFAIPINLAKDIMEQLIKNGHIVRGWIGAQLQDLNNELKSRLGYSEDYGVYVQGVIRNSPAQKIF